MSICAYKVPVAPTPATVEFAQKIVREMDRPGYLTQVILIR